MDPIAMTAKAMSTVLFIIVLLTISDMILADDADVESMEELKVYRIAIEFLRECGNKDFSLCCKERALKYLDTLPNEFDVGAGFVIKSNGRNVKRMQRDSLPVEPKAREDAIDNILWERIAEYLSSHIIEFKMPSSAIHEMTKSVQEGRRKGGGGGGGKKGEGDGKMKGMMMMFQLKAAILGAIALKFIGLVAFKALLIAKVALTLSSIIALKKLLEGKHHTSTYEVVATHPHHDDYGHADRSFMQDQLAYKGYQGAARNRFS